MFGMVLAIGILVDDAIVVVENVERIMSEEGLSPREATRKAMSQITGAIIGITLVLIAVFIPMAFFGGAVGAIYRQFSLSMVSAMVFSALMALTLTPALCATMLKPVESGPPSREARLLRLVQPPFRCHRHALPGRDRENADRTGRFMLVFALILASWAGCMHACPPPSCRTRTRAMRHQHAAAAGRITQPHRGRAGAGGCLFPQAAGRGAHHFGGAASRSPATARMRVSCSCR
jgi:multidrug efflux pump subunit AcrB